MSGIDAFFGRGELSRERQTETVKACAIGGADFSTISRSKDNSRLKRNTGAERLDAFRNATFKTQTRSNGEGLE